VDALNRNLIFLYFGCFVLADLDRHHITYCCWQVWTDITQYTAVPTNKVCHEVGLRKQHLGYHNSWDCWCFILLVWFWVLHTVAVGSAY